MPQLSEPINEQVINDLRKGIESAPANVVANNREQLLYVFKVLDAYKAENAELKAKLPAKPEGK